MSGSSHRRRGAVEVAMQDDVEAVVFKPAGLSSERPSNGSASESDSLIARVRRQFGWPEARLPHRLDRPTRGLVMVSRDAAVAARHAAEIRAGAWTKWYFARIASHSAIDRLREARGLIGPHRAFLRQVGRRAEVVRSGGDPSRLAVLAVSEATDNRRDAHALIRLDTGRYHQIRAMMAALGFPLVGDPLYGGRRRVPAGATPAVQAALAAFRRQALHAARLALEHPTSGRHLEFEAPLPADFLALVEVLAQEPEGG